MKASRVTLAAFLMSTVCLGQSPREIAMTALRSVVILEMADSSGQPFSLGSGFFVSDQLVATNAHVIEGASGGTAKLVGSANRMKIIGTVGIDRRADIAILKVDGQAPPLKLKSENNSVIGDKVYVVGNPLGLEGTFSDGIISGLRRIGSDSVIQMTAPISPGSSGGPVMNTDGEVIGVSVAAFTSGQNLNLAIPAAYVKSLLATVTANSRAVPLGTTALENQNIKSITDEVGTRIETGVVASGFQYDKNEAYEFKVANKLPTAISQIRIRIIYRDAFKAIMDFEDLVYKESIPPGLTKTIRIELHNYPLNTAWSAFMYYFSHREDGAKAQDEDYQELFKLSPVPPTLMAPKAELKVVSFEMSEDQ